MPRLTPEEEQVLLKLMREIDTVPHLHRGVGNLPDYFETSAYYRQLDPEMKRILSVCVNNVLLEKRLDDIEKNRWPVKLIRFYNYVLDSIVNAILKWRRKNGKSRSKYAHPTVLKAGINKGIKFVGFLVLGGITAKLISMYVNPLLVGITVITILSGVIFWWVRQK